MPSYEACPKCKESPPERPVESANGIGKVLREIAVQMAEDGRRFHFTCMACKHRWLGKDPR